MLSEAQKQAIRTELDRALAPLLRATERGAGSGESTVRLRERQERFLEAARRQEVRESERAAKSQRKADRKLFESLGMPKAQAKLAAAGLAPRNHSLDGLVLGEMAATPYFEEQMRLSEAARDAARESEKRQLEDAVSVFERLGLPRDSAQKAAVGRR